jgi:hypothetical protein
MQPETFTSMVSVAPLAMFMVQVITSLLLLNLMLQLPVDGVADANVPQPLLPPWTFTFVRFTPVQFFTLIRKVQPPFGQQLGGGAPGPLAKVAATVTPSQEALIIRPSQGL